jgi:hypothetical protein
MNEGSAEFWAKTVRDAQGSETPGISVRDHCLNAGCVAEALSINPAALGERDHRG